MRFNGSAKPVVGRQIAIEAEVIGHPLLAAAS